MSEFAPRPSISDLEAGIDTREIIKFTVTSELQAVLDLLSPFMPENQVTKTSLELAEALGIRRQEVMNRIKVMQRKKIPIDHKDVINTSVNKRRLVGFFLNDKNIKVETEIDDTPQNHPRIKRASIPRVRFDQDEAILRNFPPPKVLPPRRLLPVIDWRRYYKPAPHTLKPEEVPDLHDSALRPFIAKKPPTSK